MADNFVTNAGSGGDTFAADDIAGVKHQRVKIEIGADGSATDVSSANPLPVSDNGGSLTIDGTVTANAGTGTFTVDGSGVTQPISGSVTANAGTNLNTSALALDATLTDRTQKAQITDGTNEMGIVFSSIVPTWPVTLFDGSTGVPIGSLTNPIVAHVQDGGGSITIDGTVTVNAGTDLNTSALALESGGNLATIAGAVSGSEMQVDVVAALPAGTNTIGKLAANSGVDIGDVTLTSGTADVGNVGLAPRTSGGLLMSKTISAASTNATSVKGSAGQLYGYSIHNENTTWRYLKIYNKASAPTVGTDTPVLTIPIVPGGGANIDITNGLAFSAGIAFALTTGIADSDTGAVAANEIAINLWYK